MLYRIQYDSVDYYVEVPKPKTGSAITPAVTAWHHRMAEEWGGDYIGDEEPDSVELVSEEDVIR